MERRRGLLRGWKEIEAYLGLSRKTIRRQGFPVRIRKRNGSVYADTGEIERFLLDEKAAMPQNAANERK